jgi:hypothetical protein
LIQQQSNKTTFKDLEIIMRHTFEQHRSLQLSQWLGLGFVRSEMCDDYRPSFEPRTALCEGIPGGN